MPKDRSERTGSREPHARPVRPHARAAASATPPRRGDGGAGALKTPARVGIAAVASLALVLAVVGFFGSASRNPDSVAVAGATQAPSGEPSASAEGGLAASPPVAPSPPAASPSTPASASPSATPVVDPLAGVPSARLQKAVDAWRKKTGVPGISVAVVWDDGRAWAGSAGMADAKAKDPMTTGTAFALASVSKMYTAAVVLQLVDEGRVGLDQSASELLPEYPLDKRITVRMLLDHRSSLPDFFSNAKIDKALQQDKDAAWTPDRTWKYVPKWRPKPGSVYDYSNTNYLLLGEVVENVTGSTLASEVRTRILEPLELDTTWYQGVEEPRAKGTTGYRLYRSGSGSRVVPVATSGSVMPFRSVVTAAGGAGSMAATATDAARFMQAYGSGDLVGATMHREMIADAKRTRAMRAIVPYGLGVQVITIEEQKTLGHSGRYLGFQNTVRYLRGPGISVAILTNQNTWDPAILMRTLIRILAPAD